MRGSNGSRRTFNDSDAYIRVGDGLRSHLSRFCARPRRAGIRRQCARRCTSRRIWSVSSVGLPTWDGIRQGLPFFQTASSPLDGVPLRRAEGSYAATAWDQAIARADRGGRASVRVDVDTKSGPRTVDLAFAPLSPLALVAQAPGYRCSSRASTSSPPSWRAPANPRGPLAGTFARTAARVGADARDLLRLPHPSRVLVPIGDIAICMVATSYLMLGLRLPDDVPFLTAPPLDSSAPSTP